MHTDNYQSVDSICFGLNRETDENSLALFLQRFSDKKLMKVLLPRLTDNEIQQIVDLSTTIMRNHLDEKEYHKLFLGDT